MNQAAATQLDPFVPGIDPPEARPVAATRGKGQELLKLGLNYFHEALADYILMNPGATLREIGDHFSYTPPWICQVINSDMFQAYLHERRAGVTGAVLQSLPKKLEAAAHMVTEKLLEKIPEMQDSELIKDTFDSVMKAWGYRPGAPLANNGQIVQNNFFLSKDELQSARKELIENHSNRRPEEIVVPAGAVERLPDDRAAEV